MAIKIPQKPRHGFHSIRELTRCVNGLIDYISAFTFIGKDGIEVRARQHQVEFTLNQAVSTPMTNMGYQGFFQVKIQDDEIVICNGADPESSYAGIAYYNAKKVQCVKKNLPVDTGYVLLAVSKSSTYQVSYSIESQIPDMPTMEDPQGDNTVQYPLAEICKNDEGKFIARQICYGIPQLWCFAVCDEEEKEE